MRPQSDRSPLWGVSASLATVALWVLSLPPFHFAEAAYIAFVPLLIWLKTRPRGRSIWIAGIGAGWIGWLAILIWLRHVTVFGTLGLSLILGCFFAVWLRAAASAGTALQGRAFPLRLLGFAGLAGFWVLLEWMRTWFLWGFPWAPLALSQWERPVVLQVAAWTGAYGVSFLLVFFNLAITHTLWHRITARERKIWTGWFSPDLYAALCCLLLAFTVFFRSLPERGSAERLFTAGVVQPYIPADLKWDESRELENLGILETQTRFVGALQSDVLLWPEAATPWPALGTPQMRARIERLVDEIGRPLLMGNLARSPDGAAWQNAAFLVEPEAGLDEAFYAKRELVPFGEYVPLRRFIPFVEKVVPIGGDFAAGTEPVLLPLKIGNRVHQVAPLICYEDIFPKLARESARAGADLFFVTTNNAWYGEEGGAYQHAAHSVLRAVETRRPVMRAGNGGWSGWIDSYGTIRSVLRDEHDSIYFRGGGTYELFQYGEWTNRQSFYTRHGDWFVGLCAAFALLAGLVAVTARFDE